MNFESACSTTLKTQDTITYECRMSIHELIVLLIGTVNNTYTVIISTKLPTKPFNQKTITQD